MQALYGDAGPGHAEAPLTLTRFGGGWTSGALNGTDPCAPPGHQWPVARRPRRRHAAGRHHGESLVADFRHPLRRPPWRRHHRDDPRHRGSRRHLPSNSQETEVRSFRAVLPDAGSTEIRIQTDGRPVTLLGFNLVNDNPGVRVHRASNGGWGIDHYLRRDFTFDDELKLFSTDMVMIAIGANDGIAAQQRDEYLGKWNRLVDRIEAAVPESEIVIVAPYDFGQPHAGAVGDVMEEVAAARGLGFINLYETAGNYRFFQAADTSATDCTSPPPARLGRQPRVRGLPRQRTGLTRAGVDAGRVRRRRSAAAATGPAWRVP